MLPLLAENLSSQTLTLEDFLRVTAGLITVLVLVAGWLLKIITAIKNDFKNNMAASITRLDGQDQEISSLKTQVAIVVKLDEQRQSRDTEVNKKLDNILEKIGKLQVSVALVQGRSGIQPGDDQNGG